MQRSRVLLRAATFNAGIDGGRRSAFQAVPSGFDPRYPLYATVREVRPRLAKSGVRVRVPSVAQCSTEQMQVKPQGAAACSHRAQGRFDPGRLL